MSKRISSILLVFIVTQILCGCNVPNLRPFAEATVELRNGIVAAGDTVSIAMMEAEEGRGSEPSHRLSFEEAWRYRVAAMDALVEYAAALVAIADSGEQSREAVRRLNQSVARLASAITPLGGMSSEASSIVNQVSDWAHEARRFYTLRAYVDDAHPHIEQIGKLLSHAFRGQNASGETLSGAPVNIFWAACEDRLLDIDSAFRTVRTNHDDFVERRNRLGREMFSGSREPTKEQFEEHARLAALVDVLRPEVLMEQTLIDGVLRERARGMAMFRLTADSIDAWVLTHADLKAGLRNNRQPAVHLLLANAVELRRAIDALHDR